MCDSALLEVQFPRCVFLVDCRGIRGEAFVSIDPQIKHHLDSVNLIWLSTLYVYFNFLFFLQLVTVYIYLSVDKRCIHIIELKY